ncbi:hypothetical protein OG426_02095 [Streptomyces canus]|uniref:hypothetical protein n=1 Tax=Streptomyces canus TaxID=58343 RepID=UPI002254D98D|nr:hypothetical protein [Streptomyces canus]MCX4853419.1 hypothetical protein [Streptomyces canus]WSW31383.1 hypothetical protein OG426_02095 [Streptomyces canus]
MAGEGRPSAEADLFALEAVVVGQPKRSWWRRCAGPALAVSTVEGALLAHVTHTDDTHSLLAKASGECLVRIEWFGPAEFRFTDDMGREVGTAGAGHFIKTWQLTLGTEQGRRLLLTRRGHLSTEWQLTETDPHRSPAPEVLGRVTASTHDAWIGLQQYVVETTLGLDASERRTVIASVVCLHLLRRPPGSSNSA